MILVINDANIGLSGEPGGGVTLKLSNIEAGFLAGVDILIPVPKEAAMQLIDGARKLMTGLETASTMGEALHGSR